MPTNFITIKNLVDLPLMKINWNVFLALIFLGLYLTPALELDATEYEANYSNECHQYINRQDEQGCTFTKEITNRPSSCP